MDTDSVALTRQMVISSKSPVTREKLLDKLFEIAESIVCFLNEGCAKLGHIKMISTTDGEDYLQISVTDQFSKPVVKGFIKNNFSKIKLTLNIIEFGISSEEVSEIINSELIKIKEYFAKV
jgi:hypothetical protein